MKKYWFLIFIAAFFLNTASHDYLCHEELEGLCHPLHVGSTATENFFSVGIPMPSPLLALMAWTPGRLAVPGFVTHIYHPPDFPSLP